MKRRLPNHLAGEPQLSGLAHDRPATPRTNSQCAYLNGPPDAHQCYLPIAEHGVIGDLRTVALVGADGTIDWYCPPSFDSPSVFGAILDRRKGGYYRISALDDEITKQMYLPDTNVLITRFLSPEGVAELQDFMPISGEQRVIRRVVCVRGSMRFILECEPGFDYGRELHTTEVVEGGALFRSPSLALTLASSLRLGQTAMGVRGTFELSAGESTTIVLAGRSSTRSARWLHKA